METKIAEGQLLIRYVCGTNPDVCMISLNEMGKNGHQAYNLHYMLKHKDIREISIMCTCTSLEHFIILNRIFH